MDETGMINCLKVSQMGNQVRVGICQIQFFAQARSGYFHTFNALLGYGRYFFGAHIESEEGAKLFIGWRKIRIESAKGGVKGTVYLIKT